MTTSTPKPPLAALSGLLSFVLIVGGVSGLLHEWLGWIRLMGFLRFLLPHGHEVPGYLVMIALGATAGAAGAAFTRRAHR